MGSGMWSDASFRSYSRSRGRSVLDSGVIDGNISNQEIFRNTNLSPELNPKNVIRQCCDSDEHPNVVPVILALDVTGSMGQAAVEVAKTLNVVMTDLYKNVKDVEFLIMGIGDMACDSCPLQASQFESDIRIADQLEKVFFEFGGGGNGFESYSLAWYFALNHTYIDAIDKRHKKGIIITMGDEPLNPYLPKVGRHASFESVFGDTLETDIDTKTLFNEVNEKFEVFHIHVDHSKSYYYKFDSVKDSYISVIGENRLYNSSLDSIASTIVDIVKNNANHDIGVSSNTGIVKNGGEISW